MSNSPPFADARLVPIELGIVMVLIAAGTYGCGRSNQASNSRNELPRSEKVADRTFRRGAFETVHKFERAEAVRLRTDVDAPEAEDVDLTKLPSLGMPVDVLDPIASRMAAKLLAEDSYQWDSPKGCVPMYSVRVSFIRGVERTDVIFCFECSILAVAQNGKVVGFGDFDPAHTELLKDVQQLFPDDVAIQTLR